MKLAIKNQYKDGNIADVHNLMLHITIISCPDDNEKEIIYIYEQGQIKI